MPRSALQHRVVSGSLLFHAHIGQTVITTAVTIGTWLLIVFVWQHMVAPAELHRDMQNQRDVITQDRDAALSQVKGLQRQEVNDDHRRELTDLAGEFYGMVQMGFTRLQTGPPVGPAFVAHFPEVTDEILQWNEAVRRRDGRLELVRTRLLSELSHRHIDQPIFMIPQIVQTLVRLTLDRAVTGRLHTPTPQLAWQQVGDDMHVVSIGIFFHVPTASAAGLTPERCVHLITELFQNMQEWPETLALMDRDTECNQLRPTIRATLLRVSGFRKVLVAADCPQNCL